MTIEVKHKKVSAIADSGDTGIVQPSDWNDTHEIQLATARLIGRTTAGAGAAEEISAGAGLSLSGLSISFDTTWGDSRYLQSFTETDPVFGASAASGISSTNINNWNTAYGWGNHASAGYAVGTVSEASTANTIVKRNASGDINARLFRSEYDATNANINYIMTQIDTVSNNYIRPSTPAQFRAAVTDGSYYSRAGAGGNITISTSNPSGGSNGDLWFKV